MHRPVHPVGVKEVKAFLSYFYFYSSFSNPSPPIQSSQFQPLCCVHCSACWVSSIAKLIARNSQFGVGEGVHGFDKFACSFHSSVSLR